MNHTKTLHNTIHHDTPNLLRLCAISLIVSGHFGFFNYGGGGAALLMVIVGYNIAKFKLFKILETNSVKPIIEMIIKVTIPTVAYILLIQLYYDSFRLADVFLVSNFLESRHPMGFSYWFIEVYIQILIILMLILSFPKVRYLFRAHGKIMSFVFLATSIFILIISETTWDTSDLYRRLPWLMIWLVAFGFSAYHTDSTYEKTSLIVFFVATSYFYYGEINIFLCIAIALLIFNPSLNIPKSLRKPMNFLAAGSLFIYLTHFQTKAILEKIISDTPLLYTVSAIIIGALIFDIYNKLVNKKLFFYFKTKAENLSRQDKLL